MSAIGIDTPLRIKTRGGTAMRTILHVSELTKTFGAKEAGFTALKGISLDVTQGSFVGIMGPSGAGKTTLLNILATIDGPSSGEVVVDGQDVTKMDEDQLATFRRQKLGFLFQDYNLLDTLTIRENILLPLALAKVEPAQIEQRVRTTAVTLGINHILDKYPYHVSGGQKQRAAAARAIIAAPALILADEPTGALDSKSAKDLLESLQELNRQDEATILMVTHDALAASYCDRVLFIKDGLINEELVKGKINQRSFFQQIVKMLAGLEG